MGDRTEDEEQRYVRRVARRMPVEPIHLARCLNPLVFTLIEADREEGYNEIQLLRPSPTLSGLFDIITVKAGLRGEESGVLCAAVTIAPGGWGMTAISESIPADSVGKTDRGALRLERADDVFVMARAVGRGRPPRRA